MVDFKKEDDISEFITKLICKIVIQGNTYWTSGLVFDMDLRRELKHFAMSTSSTVKVSQVFLNKIPDFGGDGAGCSSPPI